MVKINENEAILSKEDLAVLIGAAMASILDSYNMTENLETLIMECAAEASCKIENHIWGEEKIPEETMDMAMRMTRIYESTDPVHGPDQAWEDKQAICQLLLAVLQKTRACHDLVGLKYEPSTVTVKFAGGGYRQINVEADSGIAMICDILRRLLQAGGGMG